MNKVSKETEVSNHTEKIIGTRIMKSTYIAKVIIVTIEIKVPKVPKISKLSKLKDNKIVQGR